METSGLSVVTGAFGYTGRHIASRLLARGERVMALTGRPGIDDPFGGRVAAVPFSFDNPTELIGSLRGATTLYNTYWVRFPYGPLTHEKAVENSRTLIRAAEEAGIRRIVHISIANAASSSPLPYFRGKGMVEEAIIDSQLSYAILRPTVIFGDGDVLINNIAWLLRRFPIFVVPGSGRYRLQPVSVEDVAELAVGAADRDDNVIIDAAGPEIYTFDKLVQFIAAKIHSRAKIIHLPPRLALALGSVIGRLVKDALITDDEIKGLSASLLISQEPPTGCHRLSDWLSKHADTIGVNYASEMNRHYRSRKG